MAVPNSPGRQGMGAASRATPKATSPSFVQPYSPGWLDRLIDWADRLPGPSWLAYLIAAAFLALLLSVAHWVLPPGSAWTFIPIHLVLAAGVPAAPALVDYVDPWLSSTGA
jgi:hypothetical protein